MTILPMSPHRQLELAREYVQMDSREGRQALDADWRQRYGDDQAYELFMLSNALIAFPEDGAQFRAQWSAPHIKDSSIREIAAHLTDEQAERISAALRDNLMNHPSELPHTWALAREMAGVA